jgi:hypothetical protein
MAQANIGNDVVELGRDQVVTITNDSGASISVIAAPAKPTREDARSQGTTVAVGGSITIGGRGLQTYALLAANGVTSAVATYTASNVATTNTFKRSGRFTNSHRYYDATVNGTGDARFNNAGALTSFQGGGFITTHPILFDSEPGFELTFANFFGGSTNSVYYPEVPTGNTITVKCSLEIPIEGFTGVVASATTTAITIATGLLDTNQFTGGSQYVLRMTSGTRIGQVQIIASNTATVITLTNALSGAPAAADTFQISALVPVTFSGAASLTIADGAWARTDPIGFPLKSGTTVYAWTYVTCAAGGKIPATYRWRNSNADSRVTVDFPMYDNASLVSDGLGTDPVSLGGFSTQATPVSVNAAYGNSFSYAYGPADFICTPANKTQPFIAVVGDSKTLNDVNGHLGGSDQVYRMHAGPFGWAAITAGSWVRVFGRSAMTTGELTGRRSGYMGFICGLADHVIVEHAVNDINASGKTTNELARRLRRFTQPLMRMGIVCHGVTIPPSITATDRRGMLTAAGQTYGSLRTKIGEFNYWLRGLTQSGITIALGEVFNGSPLDLAAYLGHPTDADKWGPRDNTVMFSGTVASGVGLTQTNFTTQTIAQGDTYSGALVRITSGTYSGKTLFIRGVNASNLVVCATGYSGDDPAAAMSIGDSFEIRKIWGSTDGIHWGHLAIIDMQRDVIAPFYLTLPVVR